MRIYVVVIGRPENLGQGLEHPAVATGQDRAELIRRAIQKRSDMERKSGASYEIFVGEMTDKVQTPVEYELVSLEPKAEEIGVVKGFGSSKSMSQVSNEGTLAA